MRIIIVEDNLDGAESLEAVLEDLGHEVTIAASGGRAVEAAQKLDPHVAFIDLLLPDMNGVEVAHCLRKLSPRVELVAVTGLSAPEVKPRTLAAGFDQFLLKPYLISALEQILTNVARKF